eukprot:3072549-Amphidinium_carterae.1
MMWWRCAQSKTPGPETTACLNSHFGCTINCLRRIAYKVKLSLIGSMRQQLGICAGSQGAEWTRKTGATAS